MFVPGFIVTYFHAKPLLVAPKIQNRSFILLETQTRLDFVMDTWQH